MQITKCVCKLKFDLKHGMNYYKKTKADDYLHHQSSLYHLSFIVLSKIFREVHSREFLGLLIDFLLLLGIQLDYIS